MKFEDRSPKEIPRQGRCARGNAWKLAKRIFQLTKEDNATFYSPVEEWMVQKPHLIKNGRKIHCDTSKHVPFVFPGLSTSTSTSSASLTSSSQETVTDTENSATRRSESVSEESLAGKDPFHR